MKTFCIYDDSDLIYYLPIKSGEDINKKVYAIADAINRMDIPLDVWEVKISNYLETDTGIAGRFAIYSIRLTSSDPDDIQKLEDVVNKIEQQWTKNF